MENIYFVIRHCDRLNEFWDPNCGDYRIYNRTTAMYVRRKNAECELVRANNYIKQCIDNDTDPEKIKIDTVLCIDRKSNWYIKRLERMKEILDCGEIIAVVVNLQEITYTKK
jgi:hypothetical protein